MDILNPDAGIDTPEATPAADPAIPPVTPVKPVDAPAPPPTPPAAPVLSIEDQLKSNPDYQAHLDRVAGNARKEAREKARKDFLAELGSDDLAKVKALLDKEREREQAEMSEAQRLQAQIDTLNAEKQAALEQAKATQEQMRKSLLKSEVEKQAATFKFVDVFDLQSRLDTSTIEIDLETGTVTGVAEQAKSIAAKAKHLIEQPTPQNPAPPTPKPASPQAMATATDEERRRKAWKPR